MRLPNGSVSPADFSPQNATSPTWRVICSDVRDGLHSLHSESIQCCVTSPPYFGLRAYGTDAQVWGGDRECAHLWGEWLRGDPKGGSGTPNGRNNRGEDYARALPRGSYCVYCGAWLGELGAEPTPSLFVSHLVEVFQEVGRVLSPDGVLFVNLGDSYAGSGKGPSNSLQRPASSPSVGVRIGSAHGESGHTSGVTPPPGLKPKDLCLIPERFSIAMQEAGWYVRSRIAWCKTSAMPESVTDRPTNAWEPIYVFTKSRRYYWDADAVRVPEAVSTAPRRQRADLREKDGWTDAYQGNPPSGIQETPSSGGRNLWSYWEIEDAPAGDLTWKLGPEPFRDAHFATFPTEIPRRALSAGSRGGDTVLDPFTGSGTTGMVAMRLGRSFVGIELNPKFAEMARSRIRNDAPLLNTTAEVQM